MSGGVIEPAATQSLLPKPELDWIQVRVTPATVRRFRSKLKPESNWS